MLSCRIFILQYNLVDITACMLHVSDKGDSRVSFSLYPHSQRHHEKAIPPFGVSTFAGRLGSHTIGDCATRIPLYDEPYRPQYHFSPATHFMNDPNGLLDFNVLYLLSYQHHSLPLVAG